MITRDFLMNADCKTAFGAIEESLLWSAEQRAASLAATLACRPDNGPVWIFGYGSLMWNPALEFIESCTGTLVGWHRAFCLRLTAGRGTVHQPGRMLALKEGGRTTGVAYRLPEGSLEQELTLLWKREMITGCYLPTWCQLDLDDGRTVNALVFIMDPRHPEYESDTRAQVIAPLIAAASGPLGTNAQYLFSLEQELIKLGMQDDGLNDLLVSVKNCWRIIFRMVCYGEDLPDETSVIVGRRTPRQTLKCEHFIGCQRPLRQFDQSANFNPVNQRKWADAATIGAGLAQFHGYILRREDLQHLLNIVAFPWFLSAQSGSDRIRHQKQTQIQVALLLS